MVFFKEKKFDSKENFFALDLGDVSAKVFFAQNNGRFDKVRSYNSLEIPRGKIEDGRIIDKKEVSEIIRRAVEKSGPKKISSKKVICSVPESKAFLRVLSIPKMEEKEAAEAVKWEIEASIPLSIDQVYFDWQFLEEFENKQNVLTVAVSREIIDDLVETLKMAGFSVWGMEVESIAIARSLIPKKFSSKNTSIIVDLGAKKTSFIITEGNVPYFTSSIPFSSETISDAISKSLNISRDEAEEIKIADGLENFFQSNPVFSSIEPLLENLFLEIQKTIDFYGELTSKSKRVEKIILSGGGANIKGLVPYLTARLSQKVEIGDPWVNFDFGEKLPPISRQESITYSTAIGLVMGKINLWK